MGMTTPGQGIPIVDILGLTTPINAQFVSHNDTTSWLALEKPDYVVIHDPIWIWEKVVVENGEYKEIPDASPKDATIGGAIDQSDVKFFCVACILHRQSPAANQASLKDVFFSDHVVISLHLPKANAHSDKDSGRIKLYGRIMK